MSLASAWETLERLAKYAGAADKVFERFVPSRKCKFCGAAISGSVAFCGRCGKSQA